MHHINCASSTLPIWCSDHGESALKHRSRARLSHSPPHTPSWAESFLTILHTLSWLTLSTDQRLTAPEPSLGLDALPQYSNHSHAQYSILVPWMPPPPKKKRELGGEVGEVAVESNGVGCWSEGKGRVDRCCCQDLSVKTNGCCKDEASKTLENSDVVNHRPFCVHLCVCVCHVRLVQRACGWMKCMYRCGSRLRPSHMGQCWEIDFSGLWGRQRWICLSDYRRKIANTKR